MSSSDGVGSNKESMEREDTASSAATRRIRSSASAGESLRSSSSSMCAPRCCFSRHHGRQPRKRGTKFQIRKGHRAPLEDIQRGDGHHGRRGGVHRSPEGLQRCARRLKHALNTPQTRLKPAARVVPRSCRPREKVPSIGSVPKMTRRSRPSSPASSRVRRQRQG